MIRRLLLAVLVFALSLSGTEAAMRVVQPHGWVKLLVTGASGMGKSVFTQRYIEPVWRVALYDAEGEYDQYRWIYADEFAGRWQDWRFGTLQLAVRPRPGHRDRGPGGEHELFCATALKVTRNGGPMLTVHEEVSAYAGASPSQTYENFTELILRGRKAGCSMLVTGQHLHLFPTAYRNNLTRLIVYSLPNKSAADALEELTDRKTAATALELPPFHFIDWAPKTVARIRPPLADT